MWFRFYYAEKRGKKMIESDIDDNDDKSTKRSNNN